MGLNLINDAKENLNQFSSEKEKREKAAVNGNPIDDDSDKIKGRVQEELEEKENKREENNEESNKNERGKEEGGDERKQETDSGEHIKWFSELSNDDVKIAGGKGASLGEMYNNKFPVPLGFVVTASAFSYFIEKGGIKEKIKDIVGNADVDDTDALTEASKKVRKLIEDLEMPKDLREEILEAYKILSSENIDEEDISQDALNILKNANEPAFVSVRSSATTEDLADASFAGQQDTFLNVKGRDFLIEYIKKCFSSLYTARAIFYRKKKGFKEGEALLAVVVQKMIDSEQSGVAFSRDPTNKTDNIIVESVFGLGEGIVSGKIKPDHYVVSRDLKLKDTKVADKKIAIVRKGNGENGIVKLSSNKSNSQVLSQGQILEIANLAIKLEEHYKKPQDIEFAVERGEVYIVQSRPITTIKERKEQGELSGNVVLEGLGASPGIGVGTVKIIKSMSDLSKIKKGDVLVTEMTNPDMVVAMQKSAAIITDEGGMTSHASIVSREMGIPCIVGTGEATKKLKEGMKITIDGTNGQVYEGEVAEQKKAEIKPVVETKSVNIKVIVDLPKFAERAAKSGISAVGLTRLEGIIASSKKHPLQYLKDDDVEEYIQLLSKGIEEIAKNFNQIWIRASDIRTDEYSSLEGAPEREINPMLGLHGVRFSLKHPEILKAELGAIKRVSEKFPNKKIGIMFPQVISMDEVKKVKEYFNEMKINNMQFGVMIETPAAVQIIEDICKEVEFISFGTNDLTQFTLGVDRGDDDVQHLYNEMHPAIFSQISKVINVCKKNNVETSICGQAGSKKEMVRFLVKEGIDSISVNADAAHGISQLVKEMEDSVEEPEKREQPEVQGYGKQEGKQQPEGQEIRKKYADSGQSQEKSQEPEEEESGDEKKYPIKVKRGYLIKCDNCGKEAKVPFKPKPGIPVYCKKCYKNKKKQENKEKSKLPKLPSNNEPANIKDYKNQSKNLGNKENFNEFSNEKNKQETQQNVGNIEPFNNTNRIENKSEKIHNQVERGNEKKDEQYEKKEDNIKTDYVDDSDIEEVSEEELNEGLKNNVVEPDTGNYKPGVFEPDSNEDDSSPAKGYDF